MYEKCNFSRYFFDFLSTNHSQHPWRLHNNSEKSKEAQNGETKPSNERPDGEHSDALHEELIVSFRGVENIGSK